MKPVEGPAPASVVDISTRSRQVAASRSALALKRRPECDHHRVTYQVNPAERDVRCGRCGAPLNPIWVLEQLARSESRLNEAVEVYQQWKAEHEQRSRCKCQHCGRMTRIRGA